MWTAVLDWNVSVAVRGGLSRLLALCLHPVRGAGPSSGVPGPHASAARSWTLTQLYQPPRRLAQDEWLGQRDGRGCRTWSLRPGALVGCPSTERVGDLVRDDVFPFVRRDTHLAPVACLNSHYPPQLCRQEPRRAASSGRLYPSTSPAPSGVACLGRSG